MSDPSNSGSSIGYGFSGPSVSSTADGNKGVPMFVKVIGGIIFLLVIVFFLRWVQTKIVRPDATAAVIKPPVSVVQNVPVNKLPTQDIPTAVYNWTGGDCVSPTNWTFSNGACRVRNTDNAWGNLVNPSSSPYYNFMQGADAFVRTTVTNLTIGKSYQLTGFVSNRPDYPAASFEVRLDGAMLMPKMGPLASTFVPFGPITVKATATSHTLEFRNVSDAGDCTVLLDGLSFK